MGDPLKGEFAQWARAQGCTVEHRKSGHLRVTLPDGRSVFASATPGDWRANRNKQALIRRMLREDGSGPELESRGADAAQSAAADSEAAPESRQPSSRRQRQ